MNPQKTLKIPIYDDYRMVLIFPSPPSPQPSAALNLEVSFHIKKNTLHLFVTRVVVTLPWQQMRRNIYITHFGYYLLAPFLPEHDYLLVPCNTTQMIYYEQSPECLQDYKYLGILKQPEVNKIPFIRFFSSSLLLFSGYCVSTSTKFN